MGFGTSTKVPHIELRPDGHLYIDDDDQGITARFDYSSERVGDEVHRSLELHLKPTPAPTAEDFLSGLSERHTREMYRTLETVLANLERFRNRVIVTQLEAMQIEPLEVDGYDEIVHSLRSVVGVIAHEATKPSATPAE
jgi:hypothetical protein